MLPFMNPQTSDNHSAFLLHLLALGDSVELSHGGVLAHSHRCPREPVPQDLQLEEPNHAVSSKALFHAQASAFSF